MDRPDKDVTVMQHSQQIPSRAARGGRQLPVTRPKSHLNTNFTPGDVRDTESTVPVLSEYEDAIVKADKNSRGLRY